MKSKNNAIILLGSNIRPTENLKKAIQFLGDSAEIKSHSRVWVTAAVGSDGPSFLNMAVEVETPLDAGEFKTTVISVIETRLGRIRTNDPYAPRTIDLDIIIFNDQVLDNNLWDKAFVAQPVSDLRPQQINPEDQSTLKQIAVKLKSSTCVELFDLDIY